MQINCPACGAPLDARLKYSKLVVCAYCRMALFLEDEAVKAAGKMSVLTDQPSIFALGKRYAWRQAAFVPVGRLRYAYPGGRWEEWWVLGDDGAPYWVSVDEGDIAVESPVEAGPGVPPFSDIRLGQEIVLNGEAARVTEKNVCRCAGAEGELPFAIKMDEEHRYADLTGKENALFTLEYTSAGTECFKGRWIDPFDIKEA